MTEVTPKPGERWRFTYEGTISSVMPGSTGPHCLFSERDSLGQNFSHGVWERLPDPEPEWKPGDIVQDAIGEQYVRMPADWRGLRGNAPYPWMKLNNGVGWGMGDSGLRRPLKRLTMTEGTE